MERQPSPQHSLLLRPCRVGARGLAVRGKWMAGTRSPAAGSRQPGTKTWKPGEGRGEGMQPSDLMTADLPPVPLAQAGEGSLLRPDSCRRCRGATDTGQSRGSAPQGHRSGHGAGAGH